MITIITMTYNGARWLEQCIQTFLDNEPDIDYEWLIFDCASSDDTNGVINNFSNNKIKPYEISNNNASFSEVNNLGARMARNDYLLFLNNDIEFLNTCSVTNMLIALEKYNAGCVGAKLLYPDGAVQHAGVYFRTNGLPWHARKNVTKESLRYDREYQAVTAACMLCKKEDFWNIGGFDPRYYFCFEDVDLCLKMKKVLGKRSVFCANTEFVHHESRTILALENKKQRFVEAARLLREKWGSYVVIDEQRYIDDVFYKVMK